MAKAKEKMLVHYFKVAIGQDPMSSDANEAKDDLLAVEDVMDVSYVRSVMKIKDAKK